MVEYIRKCSKGVGEAVVIEIAQVGMTTRTMAAEEVGSEKRRKVGNGEPRLPSSTLVQITTEGNTRDPYAAASSLSCDHVLVSCCSSNESTEELQFTDLEGSVEIGTVARYTLDTRARSKLVLKLRDHSFSKPRSKFKAGSGVLETITAKPSTMINYRRTVPVEKMPPAAELEEFFASAEKDLHKRFKEKYNYDIANDTPLKGQFEWVRQKP